MKQVKLKRIVAMICGMILCLSCMSGCKKNDNEEMDQPQTEQTQPNHSTQASNSGGNIELTILGTSDVHNYLMNYDYYTVSESEKNGLVKVSTIIKQYRAYTPNVLVFDNGDLIQGNPLGDYFARVAPVEAGTEHPVYQALRIAGYDGGTLGNHEFNYGLDYLHQILNDSQVPIVNTNIYNAVTNEPEFTQYLILNKTFIDNSGREQVIKVGVLGFVPPQILEWDKINLDGKIIVKDIVESAQEIVPVLKAEGADIIVALCHSGYGNGVYQAGNENEAYDLTKVEGIDAVLAGHSHDTFPSISFAADNTGLTDVDADKGTMNGVVTVQPAKYAEGVGVIHLTLSNVNSQYAVTDGYSEFISAENVENDEELVDALLEQHEQVVAYVNSPVGRSKRNITTYFALVSDNDAVQLVSDAQIAYARRKVTEEEALKEYQDLPILSAAAPFKAGLSKDGTKAEDYVDIMAGELSIKDIANIYKYPNTAVIMKLNGNEIRNWLEMCAGLFNTIDPAVTKNQELLNRNYAAFNFDTLDGVTYEIDVTEPPKYDTDGILIHEGSGRIVNLRYQGNEIKDSDEFLVITNNYRASGGGNFPIFEREGNILYISSDETRQIITDYVKEQGTIDIAADQNWKLSNQTMTGKVTFLSGTKAEQLADEYSYLRVDDISDNGLTQYEYVFGK